MENVKQENRIQILKYVLADGTWWALVLSLIGLVANYHFLGNADIGWYLGGILLMAASDAILYGKVLTWQKLYDASQRVQIAVRCSDTQKEFASARAAYRGFQHVVNASVVLAAAVFAPHGPIVAFFLALSIWCGTHDDWYHLLLGRLPAWHSRPEPWKWWTPVGLIKKLLGREVTAKENVLQAAFAFVVSIVGVVYADFIMRIISFVIRIASDFVR